MAALHGSDRLLRLFSMPGPDPKPTDCDSSFEFEFDFGFESEIFSAPPIYPNPKPNSIEIFLPNSNPNPKIRSLPIGVPTKPPSDKKKTKEKAYRQSAPVTVPALRMADLDDDDGGMMMEMVVPPHEILARKKAGNGSPATNFSVLEGVGRTLKGRDLSRVRTAVLLKTGFID